MFRSDLYLSSHKSTNAFSRVRWSLLITLLSAVFEITENAVLHQISDAPNRFPSAQNT